MQATWHAKPQLEGTQQETANQVSITSSSSPVPHITTQLSTERESATKHFA